MKEKVIAERKEVAITLALDEKTKLWEQWSGQFQIVTAQGEMIIVTAVEYRKAAMSYQALVGNALFEFSLIENDRTLLDVNYDEMDMMSIRDKATSLEKVSQKAYAQCTKEAGAYDRMISQNMGIL